MKSSIVSLSHSLETKKTTSVALLKFYLDRIKQFNPKLNAFIEVEEKEALIQAEESDKRRIAGKLLSPYDGIPIGIKDNIVTKGRITECASKILKGYVSPFSATVIDKLTNKGFVTIGRLNMDEFAMGSSTENSSYGVTRNPYNLDCAPGGSSGGSASAVGANLIPMALGSDTGGSIRQPAAFCANVGLKPTYGTVSRFGLVAFASSLDQVGPITQTVDDCSILYDVLKGFDEKDSTTIPNNYYTQVSYNPSKIKIGYPKSLLSRCSADVQKSFMTVIEHLKKEGHEFIDVEIPYLEYAIPAYYIIAPCEASSNLARFDGIRYGYRSVSDDLDKVYSQSKTEAFGAEVQRRILLGTFALSSGYYDAYYSKAQKVRALMRKGYTDLFTNMDAILLPTAPTAPFKIGEKTKNLLDMYLSDELTVSASLAGIPALSVPGPFDKLPIGIQIQGNYFSESILFDIARKIEKGFPSQLPILN